MSKFENYPKTELFEVIDTIGVPHLYCIGPRHIDHAADHFLGMLSKAAILDAESKGIHCAMRGCNLSYEDHKSTILLSVDSDKELKDIEELQPYLLSIKDQLLKDNYFGVSFIKKSDVKKR